MGITTTLYDRRALDCTSTLPLINSLNHLAYLTTSSARIRDILTVDGGIERLVCILKQGRVNHYMELWKWNLAFQCTVNIGVRGSEAVRARIVEADIVPIIATMLNNYIKVSDRMREKAEEERQLSRQADGSRAGRPRSRHSGSTFSSRSGRVDAESRTFRRQAAPPSIEIPNAGTPSIATLQPPPATGDMATSLTSSVITPISQQFPLTSPPERTTFSSAPHHHRHHHHRNQDPRNGAGPSRAHIVQPLATALPIMNTDPVNLRPVRDADRLPSMVPLPSVVPYNHSGLTSQPESPTTPLAPTQLRTTATLRARRRPSIRHQTSTANEAEDANADSMASDESGEPETGTSAGITAAAEIQDVVMEDADNVTIAVEETDMSTPTISEAVGDGTFNIAQASAPDVRDAPVDPDTITTAVMSAVDPALEAGNNIAAPSPAQFHAAAALPRYMLDRPQTSTLIKGCPRDDDVLMALQLLAYVSKYCSLRTYFQETHLVPRLKISDEEMQLLEMKPEEAGASLPDRFDVEYEEEYLQPDDFNIFPLIEKFTMRHHSQDMQYWAGVVMRNLCRKDDSRGGIRQCAYWRCGRWEEYTRQFAKCRRCRRTKYCSKECQKSAWVYHRHWCVAANQ